MSGVVSDETTHVFIGLYRGPDGKITWTDGVPYLYSHGLPEETDTKKRCG